MYDKLRSMLSGVTQCEKDENNETKTTSILGVAFVPLVDRQVDGTQYVQKNTSSEKEVDKTTDV